jgi:hypothetical protein
VSSEHPDFPLEGILAEGVGWRAGVEGRQTIRLEFDAPQDVSHVSLLFQENEFPRTQEFALLWKGEGDGVYRELRRQQFHFSPPDTVNEHEDFLVSLQRVVAFELQISPEISGGGLASLECLRMD